MTKQNGSRRALRWMGCMLLSTIVTCHATAEPLKQEVGADASDAAIGAEWKALLEHGDSEAIYATYTLIDSLYDENNAIDTTRCAEHATEIEQALKVNRVGLGLWWAAQECAAGNNDGDVAAERLARFEALLRHAFAERPDDNGSTPIRIIAQRDADAVVEASGQELLYSYYDTFSNQRHLTLFVGLWDETAKRERLLLFDFLDTMVRLRRAEPSTEFPSYRRILAKALLADGAKDAPHTPAGKADTLNQLMDLPSIGERIEALGRSAADGNFHAALALIQVCLAMPSLACDGKAIDSILPYAELRFAPALVMLAAVYSSGSEALRDDKAARSLLDAADARLGERRGRLLFTSISMARPQLARLWPLARKELEEAAAGGNSTALLLALTATTKISGKPISERDMGRMRQAAQRGFPGAQYIYGAHLAEQGQFEEAIKWTELAAAANFTPAQTWIGNAFYTGKNLPRDVDRGLMWLARAGHGGDAQAMVTIGKHLIASNDSTDSRRRAEGWLGSATYVGNVTGALALADLYETGGVGLEGNIQDAVLIYQDLAERLDVATARRRWALLLWAGRGVERDRPKAESLLRSDAQKSDAAAQRSLASLLVQVPTRHVEALDWLRKASASGDEDASNDLAGALWYGLGGEPDPVAAESLWQTLVKQGHEASANNYAWALCTGSKSTSIDGVRGVGLLQAFSDDRPRWANAIDTLAACHATAGNFTAAALTQQRAINIYDEKLHPEWFRERLSARLTLYKNGTRYIKTEMPGEVTH